MGRLSQSLLPFLRRDAWLLALLATLAPAPVLAGWIEKVPVNQPPETILTSGPPDSTSGTLYRVRFYWAGTDVDGRVDHFDFIMVDHPRSKDSIGPGGMDPVVITVPAPDDPRWITTTVRDSLFICSADTLRRDPRPGTGESPGDVLRQPFERWHTFFIRAVDDQGEPDPTPDYRSFNALNLAPTIHLLPPVRAGERLNVTPVVQLSWDGEDPVDENTQIVPVASRYVIIDSRFYAGFPDSLYVLPSRFTWSEWKPWNAPDGSGRNVEISGLARPDDSPGSGQYIFVVQALDEAGAITPVFDDSSPDRNNVALLSVNDGFGLVLTVREEFLGVQMFYRDSYPVRLDIASDQPLAFRWSAEACCYVAEVTGYRYGWDITYPDDDSEWSAWSLSNTKSPSRSFHSGIHRFFIQARDQAENVTQAVYELTMHGLTRERDLLWVDDTDHLTHWQAEDDEDDRWLQVFETLATSGLRFDPTLDVYEVKTNRNEPPPVYKVFDAKAVVWSIRSGRDGSSGLRRLSLFWDPIVSRHWNEPHPYDYLSPYISLGGHLWINGFRPAKQLWPLERRRGEEGEPVNVTNWDDPIEPHPPGIDSVGTKSLLYRMGVEMFDAGSSLEIERNEPEYFCLGLRPVTPDAPALQVGPFWGQGGTTGRTNIEIYNMPIALAEQVPPLAPSPSRVRVLYTYDCPVVQDSAQGVVYPLTGDEQPMLVLARASEQDPYYATAICGFEPYLLEMDSHVLLARHLLQEMGLGPTTVFLKFFSTDLSDGKVRASWTVSAGDRAVEFLLRASSDEVEWSVPFTTKDAWNYETVDDSPHLAEATTVVYALYVREGGAPWTLLERKTVDLSRQAPRLQLLAPRPNPFNPSVTIPFVLPARQRVRLEIYQVDGRRITTLLSEIRPAGPGQTVWDGTDASGQPVASGLYLVLLESGGVRLSHKLVQLQ